MAARKATQAQHRNKEGVLEFKKSEALKKAWKPFTFKVSASTYLLCFKTTDLSKPDGSILLASVTKVLPSASKGASFPFEVIFKGKGSPWKLNASSNEDRISWMEAILPGSSSTLTNFKKTMESHSPPPAGGYPYNSPPPYPAKDSTNISPGDPLKSHIHADPNPYSTVPKLASSPRDNSDDDAFLIASLPSMPTIAQEYLLPHEKSAQGPLRGHAKNHMSPKRGMSAGEVEVSKPKPSPRPRRGTAPPVSPRKNPPTANGRRATITTDDADDVPYITMMSSPIRKPKPKSTNSENNLELPDYLEVVSSRTNPVLDECNYVLTQPLSVPESPSAAPTTDPGGSYKSLSDSIQSSGGKYQQGAGAGDQQDGATNLADTISRHFNPDQIGMLIRMLQEVRADGKQSNEEVAKASEMGSPTSPASPSPIVYSEQDSVTLQGNLKRALSYAPPLTERILVTEEDSEESYEVRPQWAKALSCDPHMLPGTQPDTLSDLEHEALYLDKRDISDLHVIGQGQFGKVFRGVLKRGSESMPVAIKMTKKSNSEYLQQSFMREMSIMSEMMHPNIIRMYGLVTEDVVSPWIVLEYMENGDLKSFLTKNQRPIQQLVKYMVDVAMGMHYISEIGLVHRDLAARNVLVGANEICKVADFGLLRELPRDDSVYQSQHNLPCPIRWMPPESISDRKFSAASDVWSFGVLVWEMFNPTKLPYEKYDNLACATKVNEGLRMPIPRGTPSVVAKIMKACWHKNPNKRPSFLLISTLLSTRTTF